MESVGPGNRRPEMVVFLSLESVFPDVKRLSYSCLEVEEKHKQLDRLKERT